MIRINEKWKLWIRIGLGVLVAIDAALIFFAWRASSNTPESQRLREAHLVAEQKLLAADVQRAENIKAHLATIGKQCDDFYKDQIPGSGTGYSVIEGDLGQIASKAGLKTNLIGYHQKDVKDRGVTEVEITAAVEGDYNGLLEFIGGLQKSQNFYVLDNLTLTSGTNNGGNTGLKLTMSLRTYFRTES